MTLKNSTRGARMAGVFLLAAAAAGAGSADAQCTLSSGAAGIRRFEPNPPGYPRPDTMGWGGGFSFYLYRPPAASPRLLVSESFGYQVVDLTDPLNPQALVFEDYRDSAATPIPCSGDCHSAVDTWGVSADGARFQFGLNNLQTSRYHDVVGVPSGVLVELRGDLGVPVARTGSAVHKTSTNRYIAYALSTQGLWAGDVTNPPGSLTANNVDAQETGLPAGTAPVLAGDTLVYLGVTSGNLKTGMAYAVNVGAPGPAGNIASGLSLVTITTSDWGRASSDRPAGVAAVVDPSDPSTVWILADFNDASLRNAGYSLLKLVSGVKQLPATTFRPTFSGGEIWQPGGSPVLAVTGGNLYALMWATRTVPSSVSRLYSVAVASFGATTPGSFDVDQAVVPSFGTGNAVPALAGANNTLTLYVGGQAQGWVVPLSCVSPNSPPASDLAVQPVPCPGGGAGPCLLAAGDTVFVGTTLQITPQLASARPITDWRFDYDFHPGTAEDNGTAPRINNPDLVHPASLPATLTLVGPCDPKSGGTPATGAGCWASATSNGDFSSGAPAGTTKVLTIALEAANENGPGNTRTLPLTWKVPAVRLQNPNVLLGQALASGSDGTPLATGFKWYFGATANALALAPSCTLASCAPPPPFDAKGTYYWWLTVPYPGGYTSPDCGTPCIQSLGSFSVTDVSLSFTGIPMTAIAGSGLNVTDASSAAGGATACTPGLQYAFCDAGAGSCAATNWQALALVPGAGGSTNVPAPSSAGTYWLRIRYSYRTTGSCTSPLVATWTPGVSGVSDATAWPIVVTPLPPSIQVLVNGVNPCLQPGACSDGIPAYIGDTVRVTAWLGFNPDSNPPPTTAWSFGAGASPAGCSGTGCQDTTFTYTAPGSPTISLSGYPGIANPAATKLMSVSVPPVVASNSTQPNGVCAGSSVTLTASPTVAGATYVWSGPNGFTASAQNPVINPATSAASGLYSVIRTIPGQGNSTANTTAVVLSPPPVPTAGSNTPVCAGQTLSLTAATVAGATYAWTGPNSFSSSQQNPSIANATPAATGTYVVTATVSGCSTAASTNAVVNARPVAPTAGNSGSLCIGGTLQLTASTIASATYAWTGPNGFASSLQNPAIANVTSAAAGTYSVTATVNGCTGPAGTTSAAVNGSSAAITAPASLCLPGSASGTASVADAGAGTTYVWAVTNGTIASGQGTRSISFSVSAAGTATVAVTVTAGGCATSSSVNVPVAARCGGLGTLAPCRVLDTRNPNGSLGGPAIGPASGRRFFATNVCGVPSGKAALSANVTVLSADALGSIVVYPGDLATPPNVNTVSIRPGQARANNAIIKLAPDGSFWIWNTTAGTVDVILDVNGYFD